MVKATGTEKWRGQQLILDAAKDVQSHKDKSILLDMAYADAKMAQSLQPTWAKAYFRKATVLVS